MRFTAVFLTALILGISFNFVGEAEARKKHRHGAKYCQGDHLHYGSSNSFKYRKHAMRDAIRSWAGFTIFEYGEAWGHWRLSINKSVNCSKSDGLWKCSIQSTPCRRAKRGERAKYL